MPKKPTDKYFVSGDEDEILPNKLDLTTIEGINREEFIGFLSAQEYFIDRLSPKTSFTVKYLYSIHKKALGHLYSLAGKLRNVNMSKGNFPFPASRVLPEAMESFEKDMLKKFSVQYQDEKEFILDLSRMHAELLYMHPFREGNGRTIRLFTNLITLKQFGREIDFPWVVEHKGNAYIKAVQQAAAKDYSNGRLAF